MNKLILIISIYIFNINYISAQNFSHGTFIDISDTCHTIFFDGKNYVRRLTCYPEGYKPEIFSANDPTNKLGNCGDTLINFVIDSFNKSINEYSFKAMTSQGKECQWMTIISNDSFWIVTPLKTLPNIRNHYTVNHVMVKKEFYKNFKLPKTEKLELIINEDIRDSIIYIAFDQKNQYNKLDSVLNAIYVPSSGLVKTSISATPFLLAYNAISAYVLIDGKRIEIPVVFDKLSGLGVRYIKHENRKEYIKSNRQIFFNDKYFLLVYRYNPSRDRVVNIVFGESIVGQVLDMELISIEKYINE